MFYGLYSRWLYCMKATFLGVIMVSWFYWIKSLCSVSCFFGAHTQQCSGLFLILCLWFWGEQCSTGIKHRPLHSKAHLQLREFSLWPLKSLYSEMHTEILVVFNGIIFNLLFSLGGLHMAMLKASSSFCVQELLLAGLGGQQGVHASQEPCTLYNHSNPNI